MTSWLLASNRRPRLRELVGAADYPRESAPDVVITACPRCGLEYFSDLEPDEDPITLEVDCD